MKFKDRTEAGQILAVQLQKYKGSDSIILAIPRGGVPLGYTVSKELNLPLDLVLSKKIGHPMHKEYAIGAVTLKNSVLSDVASQIPSNYIEEETQRIREKLKNKTLEYYGKNKPMSLKDKILIIVDDGIATGNTVLSTVQMLFEEAPKKIVVATPVASPSAIKKIQHSPYVDEVICIMAPEYFMAVGQFYEDFEPVDDYLVKALLQEAKLNSTT
jgi:putative phosphoribosyl transferase